MLCPLTTVRLCNGECAWWDRVHKKCAVLLIAERIDAVTTIEGDLMVRLVGEEIGGEELETDGLTEEEKRDAFERVIVSTADGSVMDWRDLIPGYFDPTAQLQGE